MNCAAVLKAIPPCQHSTGEVSQHYVHNGQGNGGVAGCPKSDKDGWNGRAILAMWRCGFDRDVSWMSGAGDGGGGIP